ncbi:MAG: type II and III secretion system protein family protein [Chlorobiaceae bacterium]|nr:type II and III secretion system protein family protein [Chlorobiaceae bacterium]
MIFSHLMRWACRISILVAVLASTFPIDTGAAPKHTGRKAVKRKHTISAPSTTFPSNYLLHEGESRVYRLAKPIARVAVGNPDVADYILINSSQLYLFGKKPGATNLILWDQSDNFTSAPLNVSRNINPIKVLLTAALPKEHDIDIYSLGPAVVLAGTVSDALAAETAWRIVKAYFNAGVPENNPEYSLTNNPPPSPVLSNVTDIAKTTSNTTSTTINGSAQTAGIPGLVNLLKIRDPQQVRLEVHIAQVSRACIQALGLNWTQNAGGVTGNIMSGFVNTATLNILFKNGNKLQAEAECKKNLVKILAEPTLVTMSGQEGYFLVGGKIYTPTVAANGAIDYVERTYGVGLRFIPTVLDGGRISLKVAPEVSKPLQDILTSGSINSLPAFSLSYASSTVQMSEGENLVIGGLLQNDLTAKIRGVPLLSNIPILGALFRRTDKDAEKTELLVVIRPTLVKASKTMPELPTDKVIPPTDKELFIDGKLQGSAVK